MFASNKKLAFSSPAQQDRQGSAVIHEIPSHAFFSLDNTENDALTWNPSPSSAAHLATPSPTITPIVGDVVNRVPVFANVPGSLARPYLIRPNGPTAAVEGKALIGAAH
ncbi:hypothetical protein MMC12_000639, partial [Toensbergia leucococca]|nr:hypothetical protein [Toensbergia leucococca]